MGWCWEGECPWLGEALAVVAALSALSGEMELQCLLQTVPPLGGWKLAISPLPGTDSKCINILICGNA